ncbi:MAG: hemolysin family protein [Oscillospiraceae bacterium]|nr:hemolysin family protein [Oscillospiraceae bacterium]
MAGLIILSAFFSATETAFLSMNRIRIKNMAENGSKRASLALKLYDGYDKLLSTILVGNNIVNLTAASVAAVFFIRHFKDAGATISTIVITLVVLFLGEITPKSLAKESPEKFALFSAPILYFFILLLTPLNFVFIQWQKLLGVIFKSSTDDRITEQELLSIVEEAEQDGAIDEEEKQLIHSVIEYNDQQAFDILTPRVNIIGIAKDTPVEDITALFLESGYSRLPVYEESLDNIVGVLHLRDFFERMVQKGEPLESIISPALFVTPSIKIKDLFKLLQKKKIHMAVVTDEYGGTDGIVTMEDILEELVGEIWDESDEIVEEFVSLGDNTYRVICAADIDNLFDFFHLHLSGEVDSSTVSGWIMDKLGKIPEKGDSFEYENLLITVTAVDQRKALECTVTVKQDEDT